MRSLGRLRKVLAELEFAPDTAALRGPFGVIGIDAVKATEAVGRRLAQRADDTPPSWLLDHRLDEPEASIALTALSSLSTSAPARAVSWAAELAARPFPRERTLRRGAIARMTWFVAANHPRAETSVLELSSALAEAWPVARLAACELADAGAREGQLGRAIRNLLAAALATVSQELDAIATAGALPGLLPREVGGVLEPGLPRRVELVSDRASHLLQSAAALAAYEQGLAARLLDAALAAPDWAAPSLLAGLFGGLAASRSGPFVSEVHTLLAEVLAHPSPMIRAGAVTAAACHSDVTILCRAIEAAVGDQDSFVRTAAALAIGDRRSCQREARARLVSLVVAGGSVERLAAARALGRVGDREVPPPGGSSSPLMTRTASYLAAPGEPGLVALIEAYVDASSEELDDLEELDERIAPLEVVSQALRDGSASSARRWFDAFLAELPGSPRSDALGELLYQACAGLDDIPPTWPSCVNRWWP